MKKIDSPCTRRCVLVQSDNKSVCKGCGREADDIFKWYSLSEELKEKALEKANQWLQLRQQQ